MNLYTVRLEFAMFELEARNEEDAKEAGLARMGLAPDDWDDEIHEIGLQREAEIDPEMTQIVAQAADIEVNVGNRLDYIMDYESGNLSATKVVALFQHLVNTGLAWQFQGCYGRMAASLIEAGLVSNA